MTRLTSRRVRLLALVFGTSGCGANAHLPVIAGTGASPALPSPDHSLLPTIKVATAVGWRPDASPTAANGLSVHAFARSLTHPRWLYVLPNGDVLVAETNAPKRPDDNKGLHSPFGMALLGDTLYVANTDAIVAVRSARGDTTIRTPSRKVLDLPGGTINHHWTKNILIAPDGSRMYVAVGSNSNAAENGMAKEEGTDGRTATTARTSTNE